MPVIGIPVNSLLNQLKLDISRDELITTLEHLGCDVEGYTTLKRRECSNCSYILELTESEGDPGKCPNCAKEFSDQVKLLHLDDLEVIRMELLAVRPDMFDTGGLSRAIRGYLGHDLGLPEYQIRTSALGVKVDPSVATDECDRPAIACAVIRNIKLNSDLIKSVMKLQDNLHWAMGRNRKHASIGIYDLDTVSGPFIYTSTAKDETPFVPLNGMPEDPAKLCTPREILKGHPKGVMFAHLLEKFSRVPILKDSENTVLSMPPIINSDLSRVTQGTKSFFIDVTGTGERIVNKVLNILVTSFAELFDGATIEKVQINKSDGTCHETPDFTTQKVTFDPRAAAKLIGVELSTEQVKECLLKMRHNVSETQDAEGSKVFNVEIAAYRNDILHPRDLIEDVAIAYGYHNIVTSLVPTMTVGKELDNTRLYNEIRSEFVGQGYLEVMSLMLTNPDKHFDYFGQSINDETVLIENPASSEQSIVRSLILPGLIEILSTNAHNSLPQSIFELGDITIYDSACETKARERKHIAAASVGPKSGFALIRSAISSLLTHLNIDFEVQACEKSFFISGRSAEIKADIQGEKITLGYVGEIHPQVLDSFKIVQPISAFEINVEQLLKCFEKRESLF